MDGAIGVIVSVTIGILCVLIGLPLMLRKVGPNRWYGYRTGATMGNERVSYAVIALTGKHLTVTGAVLILIGTFGLFALNDQRQQEMLVAIALALLAFGIAYDVLMGWRLTQSLTRDGSDKLLPLS